MRAKRRSSIERYSRNRASKNKHETTCFFKMEMPVSASLRAVKMKKTSLLLVILVGLSANLFAQPVNIKTNYNVNLRIPDNDASGLASTKSFISSFLITNITDLNVTLNIAGNFNGDLYGTLVHGSGFSVLLNRAGKRAGNDIGYGDPGFNVTLDDQAAADIHTYRLTLAGNNDTALSSALTGTWQPDGRNIDPGLVLNTDPRTALLASFNNLNPNGDWTIFLADLSPGGTSTLVSWGLDVTGVPEPSQIALWVLGGLGLCFGSRRFRKR